MSKTIFICNNKIIHTEDFLYQVYEWKKDITIENKNYEIIKYNDTNSNNNNIREIILIETDNINLYIFISLFLCLIFAILAYLYI
jgi:hypothetical protein